MHFNLIAFYAGPDQVMTVTSGLASVIGVLLIFWNKVLNFFTKFVNKVRGVPEVSSAPVVRQETPGQNL